MAAQFRWAVGTLTEAALTADAASLPNNWTQYPPNYWPRLFDIPPTIPRYSHSIETFDAGVKDIGGITFRFSLKVLTPVQYNYLRGHRFPTNGRFEDSTLRVYDGLNAAWITVNARLILNTQPTAKVGRFVDVDVRVVNGFIAAAGA